MRSANFQRGRVAKDLSVLMNITQKTECSGALFDPDALERLK